LAHAEANQRVAIYNQAAAFVSQTLNSSAPRPGRPPERIDRQIAGPCSILTAPRSAPLTAAR
jgi:hypothetical protein